MVLITTADGSCLHTGTDCGLPVAGTLTSIGQSFVTIENQLIIINGDQLDVPIHNNPPCVPPNNIPHTYNIDTVAQSWVTINNIPICLVGDSFAGDLTEIDDAGTNTFVTI